MRPSHLKIIAVLLSFLFSLSANLIADPLFVGGTGSGFLPGHPAWVWPTFDNATATQLFIHVSPDGLNWQTLNNAQPVLTATGGYLRDPALIKARGIYYLFFTAGEYGHDGYFSEYRSPDLIHWTFVQNISTTSTGQLNGNYPKGNTWSPSAYLDGDGDDETLDLTTHLRLFVTVGNGDDQPASWHIYGMTPTAQDLSVFTAPIQVGFKTGGPALALNDLTIIQTGTIWTATYVDFSIGGCPFSSATTPNNPMTWGTDNAHWTLNGGIGFWAPGTQCVEGAFLIPNLSGTNWPIYGDQGNGGLGYRRGVFNPSTHTLNTNGLSGDNIFWGATVPVFTGTTTIYRSGRPCFATLPAWMTSNYQAWRSQMFTSDQLFNPAISSDTAMPGGDGIPNLIKYALNLQAFNTGLGGLPTQGMMTLGGTNYLTLSFTQNKSATDITYYTEVSGNLLTWQSGVGFTVKEGPPLDNLNGTQTVLERDLIPMDGSSRRFIRLRVTKP